MTLFCAMLFDHPHIMVDLGVAVRPIRLRPIFPIPQEDCMNSKRWILLFRSLPLLAFVSGSLAIAQFPTHFAGLINDYSPSTVSGGPWTMHGEWSLELHRNSGTADFSADMTIPTLEAQMERLIP
jgi:hypothetical protein